MRPVKTQPRFRCDFCRRVSTEASMRRHEPMCWKNPDRFCPSCENKGYLLIDHDVDGALLERVPCYFCSQRTVESA